MRYPVVCERPLSSVWLWSFKFGDQHSGPVKLKQKQFFQILVSFKPRNVPGFEVKVCLKVLVWKPKTAIILFYFKKPFRISKNVSCSLQSFQNVHDLATNFTTKVIFMILDIKFLYSRDHHWANGMCFDIRAYDILFHELPILLTLHCKCFPLKNSNDHLWIFLIQSPSSVLDLVFHLF